MPPWPADPAYRHFSNENILSEAEKTTLQDWASAISKEKPQNPAALKSRRKPAKKGIHLAPTAATTLSASNQDRYFFHILPDTLTDNIFITGFQFHPGNLKVVHHIELLAIAPEDLPAGTDSIRTEYAYFPESLNREFQGKLNYIGGWLPGNQGERFPRNIAKPLAKGTRFVLLVHYGPYPNPASDFTTVTMLTTPKQPHNILSSFDFHGSENLPGKSLIIPADTIITYHATREVTEPLSVFSIYPHAHHLAQNMKVYATLPNQDTLPLLSIPKWQFDWQFRYDYPEFVHLPAGAIVHYLVTYNNTNSNPENPYNPPREIPNSFNAKDEMMELFLWSKPFLPGDERKKVRYPRK